MLLSVTSKKLSIVIPNQVSSKTDPLLRKEQDLEKDDHVQTFTLRQTIEQSSEWNSSVYANFIDFTKEFDSINRQALWKIPSHYGIPDKLISIVKMLYVDFHAKVLSGSSLSEELKLHTGVKQGCLLSPLLFTFCIDWIMKRTTTIKRKGID